MTPVYCAMAFADFLIITNATERKCWVPFYALRLHALSAQQFLLLGRNGFSEMSSTLFNLEFKKEVAPCLKFPMLPTKENNEELREGCVLHIVLWPVSLTQFI